MLSRDKKVLESDVTRSERSRSDSAQSLPDKLQLQHTVRTVRT